jgi:hypothetical protein
LRRAHERASSMISVRFRGTVAAPLLMVARPG